MQSGMFTEQRCFLGSAYVHASPTPLLFWIYQNAQGYQFLIFQAFGIASS